MSVPLRYVLDTHAALWAQLEPVRLSQPVRSALRGLSPALLAISDVTLTEVARLLCDGRIIPDGGGSAAWLDAFSLCFTVLPVTPRIAWTAAAFDWSHRDPCDRHILATALVRDLPLITIDPAITSFGRKIGVTVLW